MDRYQFEDLISAYIENELSLNERKKVDLYLAHNPSKAELVKQIRLNLETLKKTPKKTTKHNFNAKLLDRIKLENSHLISDFKNQGTLLGFSYQNFSILLGLVAFLFILIFEIKDALPGFKNNQIDHFVNEKNSFNKNQIKNKSNEDNNLNTDLTESKNDSIKKMEVDFSKSIKYVND